MHQLRIGLQKTKEVMRNDVNMSRNGENTIRRSGSIEPPFRRESALVDIGISHDVHDMLDLLGVSTEK